MFQIESSVLGLQCTLEIHLRRQQQPEKRLQQKNSGYSVQFAKFAQRIAVYEW